MPKSANDLIQQTQNLYLGFDENPQLITASITTQQGREMRASLNEVRQDSFLKIVEELNSEIDKESKNQFASVLQLLHSAYAWDSMRQQWNMSGSEISEATTKAITIIMNAIKKGRFT
jgi:GTPase SAR1 family protein